MHNQVNILHICCHTTHQVEDIYGKKRNMIPDKDDKKMTLDVQTKSGVHRTYIWVTGTSN